MDWQVAIERNRAALRRVLAALIAMAGFDRRFAPEAQSCHAGGSATGGEGRDAAGGSGDPAGGRPTLPRRLHRAVLRLLRPTESAARRLIIVAAKTLPQAPPAPEPARPAPRPGGTQPNAAVSVLRSLGIAIVIPPSTVLAPRRSVPAVRRPPASIALPLADRLRNPSPRLRTVPPHAAPRILSFEGAVPHRLPPPPTPNDRLDATRLVLRLRALAAALDDLPRQARRFVRWQALRARARARGLKFRISPLRSGRPPGARSASRPLDHEIHEVLRDLHWFAHQALAGPDTS